jgi:hypothetical protein
MTKLSRSILKPDRLNLTPVKSLRAIGLKRITQTLRYGLSALVRAMCVDAGDARRYLYDYWNRSWF